MGFGRRGYAVAVLLEQRGGKILAHNQAVLAAAKKLDSDVVGIVTQKGAEQVVSKLIEITGVASHLAEDVCPTLVELQAKHQFTHWLVANSSWGRSVLPRMSGMMLAAKQEHSILSDVCAILTPNQFKRPIYAGSILATVECKSSVPKLLTIRTTAFEPVSPTNGNLQAETVPAVPSGSLVKFKELSEAAASGPELGSAKRVVSGGRALKSKENFALVERLAKKLGAAVGASRAAVDAGYCPNDWQVGQTGKQVAPDLYIAVGISGAIQHVAGMKDSRVIVAINKDRDAPIFQIADYGLVGDLFKILPELTEKL